MNWNVLPYLTPYFLSFAISAGIAITCWRRSAVRGARPYGWVAFGQALWTFGYVFELINTSLEGKHFWDDFQWIGGMISLVAFPGAILEFTGSKFAQSKLIWVLLATVPALFLVALLLKDLHNLIHGTLRIIPGEPFSALDYDFGPIFWTIIDYMTIISLAFLGVLIWKLIRPGRLYRPQVAVIILGAVIPLVGIFLTTAGVRLSFQRDTTPITFAIGNIAIAWGLLRYRLFELAPIARDVIFENMTDPVVVLDNQDRIVDINHAALAYISKQASDTVGRTAMDVFSQWPELIEHFLEKYPDRAEVAVRGQGRNDHFELNISPLSNTQGRMIGRVIVARNITERKRLEQALLQINEGLEQRVENRTRDLAEAYETTLEGWARALELRDEETEGHSRRVTEMTMKLAQALSIPADQLDHIHRGAILHDIGKMAFPDEILRKTGPLNSKEQKTVMQHPTIAYELLARIPFLQKALDIPYCHHEKWDGSGYPRGLKGEQIPLAARIFTVVDIWDAIQSDRPYKKAWSRVKAIKYMQEQSGKFFDPQVVNAFLSLVENGEI
jgi:PAS domain S-box-containing protein/putative nucleotidyltransferase with HDIG domain